MIVLIKLNNSEEYKLEKETDNLRKRAERERQKLELEALQTPSTSHQTAIARASSDSSALKYRTAKQRSVKKVEKYLSKKPWEAKRSAT